jgi:ABC-2 type transport system ATP-binding protein
MQAIQVQDLIKNYGTTRAVDGISFTVEQGEVFGMLGPNGAGKTTTTEIIEGFRVADSGTASVEGVDVGREPRKVKAMIGVQLQNTALYPRLTVREVIDLFASFFSGSQRSPDELIDKVNLRDKARTQTRALSGGQRQRLSVALALINRPRVVFLDEPTTGLDPQARRGIWDTIRDIQASGATVFLTTHYLEEAQVLCNRVAVVDSGKVIAMDSPSNLINREFKESVIEFDYQNGGNSNGVRFSELAGVTRPEVLQDHHVTLYTADSPATLGALTRLADSGRIRFDSLNVRRATLEDVFLKLTGRLIRE